MLLVVLVAVYILASRSMTRLDARIQEVFDGPKWSIPARVYARPLELYAGQTIDRLHVAGELHRLGYQLTETKASKPGQFSEYQSGLLVHTRGFKFADGFEPAQPLLMQWQNNRSSAEYLRATQKIDCWSDWNNYQKAWLRHYWRLKIQNFSSTTDCLSAGYCVQSGSI